jgi:phosphoserine phosphatase RsbU/P
MLTVVSNVPMTPELLNAPASRVGSVTLLPPDTKGDVQVPPPATANPNARKQVNAGRVPPTSNWADPVFRFYTLFEVVDWETGKSETAAVGVVTRPSILYSALFATLGDNTKILWYGLLAIAVFLGLIEFVAPMIGVWLSRSITLSVAKLYGATKHVERGDLTHRIRVRGRDQMAGLEQSSTQ